MIKCIRGRALKKTEFQLQDNNWLLISLDIEIRSNDGAGRKQKQRLFCYPMIQFKILMNRYQSGKKLVFALHLMLF